MAACIGVAQIVMVRMAMRVGATADRLERQPLFLAGLLRVAHSSALYTIGERTAP
jgi:hypothetical protein